MLNLLSHHVFPQTRPTEVGCCVCTEDGFHKLCGTLYGPPPARVVPGNAHTVTHINSLQNATKKSAIL